MTVEEYAARHSAREPAEPDQPEPDQPDESGEPRGRLKVAVLWSYVLNGGRLAATTIVTFVLTALLGPEEFGLIALAVVFVTIAQTLLQQVLLTTLIQREELTGDHLDTGFWLTVLGSLVVCAVAVAITPLWASYNNLPQLAVICFALIPSILLHGLCVVPEAIMQRKLAFRQLAIRGLSAVLAGGIVGVVLAVAGFGVWALVAQQMVTALVSVVVLWIVCGWRPRLRFSGRAAKDMSGFSGHSAVGALGVILAVRADMLVMGAFFGPVAIGLYRLGSRLPDMVTEVTVRSMQTVSLPELSRLQNDRDALTAQLGKLTHAAAFVGFPALGVLAAVAAPLVHLLGDDWVPAAVPMQILCLLGAVNVVGLMLGPTQQAIGRPGVLSAFAWGQAVVSVTGFALVGSAFRGAPDGEQATAIALAFVVFELLGTALCCYVTFNRLLHTSTWRVLAPAAPSLVAGAGGFAAVFAVDRLIAPDLPALVLFVGYGALAGLVAGGLLWGGDRRIREMFGPKLGRILSRVLSRG